MKSKQRAQFQGDMHDSFTTRWPHLPARKLQTHRAGVLAGSPPDHPVSPPRNIPDPNPFGLAGHGRGSQV